MKLVIELNLDSSSNAKGSILKAMLRELVGAFDQVPDDADIRDAFRGMDDEQHIFFAEMLNAAREEAEGRALLTRVNFDTKAYALDQANKHYGAQTATVEERIYR